MAKEEAASDKGRNERSHGGSGKRSVADAQGIESCAVVAMVVPHLYGTILFMFFWPTCLPFLAVTQGTALDI